MMPGTKGRPPALRWLVMSLVIGPLFEVYRNLWVYHSHTSGFGTPVESAGQKVVRQPVA
jgi:hypothetical protein